MDNGYLRQNCCISFQLIALGPHRFCGRSSPYEGISQPPAQRFWATFQCAIISASSTIRFISYYCHLYFTSSTAPQFSKGVPRHSSKSPVVLLSYRLASRSPALIASLIPDKHGHRFALETHVRDRRTRSLFSFFAIGSLYLKTRFNSHSFLFNWCCEQVSCLNC